MNTWMLYINSIFYIEIAFFLCTKSSTYDIYWRNVFSVLCIKLIWFGFVCFFARLRPFQPKTHMIFVQQCRSYTHYISYYVLMLAFFFGRVHKIYFTICIERIMWIYISVVCVHNKRNIIKNERNRNGQWKVMCVFYLVSFMVESGQKMIVEIILCLFIIHLPNITEK